MNPVTVGIAGIGLLLLLFLLRMPVAFAMAFVGLVGFAYLADPGPALSLLAQDVFGQFSSYPLTVIPMFILMGTFAFASGISRRLYETSYMCRFCCHMRVDCGYGSDNGQDSASGDEEV